nr:protein YgfX [Paraburkholderia sp. RAU2J]
MCLALAIFVLVATSAVYTSVASHLAALQAVPLTLAVGALLTLCAIRHARAQPVALRIAPDALSVWGRSGTLLAHGRIAGCSQWSGRLLVLTLKPEEGRTSTLLLAADSLPAPVFRELSVLGRRAAGA